MDYDQKGYYSNFHFNLNPNVHRVVSEVLRDDGFSSLQTGWLSRD